MQTIEIKCKGAKLINFKDVLPIQGDLKSLSDVNYEKLKNSIINQGFSFPLLVWENKDKLYSIDGHQRCRVLGKMAEDGYNIPKIPCCFVEAKTMREAKLKVLSASSSFGKIEEQGLYEFICDIKLSADDLKQDFDLPNLNIEKFVEGFLEDETLPEKAESFKICPDCGCKFN